MTFVRPEALWLIPVVVGLALWLGRRFDRAGLLRALFVFALALALARPVLLQRADPEMLLVVDVGEPGLSPDAALARVREARASTGLDARLIVYAGIPKLIEPSSNDLALTQALAALATHPGQDPSAALDFAASLAQRDRQTTIRWFSDGHATHGAAEPALLRAAAAAKVEHRLVSARGPERRLRSAGPSAALPGETVEIELVGVGAWPDAVLAFEDALGQRGEVQVPARAEGGFRASFRYEMPLQESALVTAAVRAAGANGEVLAQTRHAILALPRPRVLVVQDPDAPDVLPALQSALGSAFDLRAVRPGDLVGALADGPDALWFADLPARLLDDPAMTAMESAVQRGLPLVLTGGQRSFGPGGYAGTPLEEMLPVRFVQREERRDPSASLVIIIDTSGSMGGGRIDLAKEVARLAMRRLEPHDKAGIVEFHGAKRWAAPLQSAGNQVDLQRALNRLQAGGGTVILPAIREAYYGLLNARTRTRHVLVLTDGGVESGAFEPLIRQMAEDGMTLSTVLVGGSGAYSSFLVSLAQWGRGRFYHCPDRFHLPEILVKQPESSLMAPWIEEAARVRTEGEAGPFGELAFAGDAALSGFLEFEAKAGAEVGLETSSGRPLLVRGHHGLGRVTVFASNVGGAAMGSLREDPETARAFAVALRESLPPRALQRGRLALASADGGLALRYEHHAEEAPPLSLAATVLTWPSARPVMQAALPVAAPGVVGPAVVLAPLEREQTYAVRAADASGQVFAEGHFYLDAHAGVLASGPRAGLAAAVAALPLPAIAIARGGMELWPYCLLLALVAGFAMLFVRRWPTRSLTTAALLVALSLAEFGAPALSAQSPGAAPAIRVTPLGGTAPGRATVTLRAPAAPPVQAAADDEAVPPLPEELIERLPAAFAAPLAPLGAAAELLDAVRKAQGELASLAEHLRQQLPAEGLVEQGLGLFYLRTLAEDGDLEAARALLARLPKPFTAETMAWAAKIHEWAGDDAEALKALEALIALAPDEEIAIRVRRAGIHFLQRDGRERGLAELDAALAKGGGDPKLAWYLAHLGALYGAPERLLQLAPLGESADERFREHLMLGQVALRAKDLVRAMQAYEAALQAAPMARDARYAQERLIAAHREAGRLPELAARWLAEKERPPERDDALIAVLRELGRPGEALQILLREGSSLQDLSRSVQREVIALGLESGEEARVLAVYEGLIAREPRRLSWRTGLSLLHLLRGRREAAEAVWREAARLFAGEPRLLAVAEGALDLGLTAVADEAGQALLALEGEPRARGLLFLAELDRRRGDGEGFAAKLRAVEEEFATDDEILALAVEAYERAQRKDEARRLLEALAQRSEAEDVAMRLAWTLEEAGETSKAVDLWLGLWKQTKIDARARQAVDRLLDLGARHARLAEIAIDLEKSLQAGSGGSRELAFLVRIYERAGDAVAAVELLREFGPKVGQDERAMLLDMARVYQQCDDYRRYDETLRRLIEIDPEAADDYRQQIALGALERGKGTEARRALRELVAHAKDERSALEFSGGIFAMVQLPKAAARAYGRVLAGWPERIETHLLRANVLQASGRGLLATRAFLKLLEDAAEDDLFTIAVDGVLNLGGQGGAYAVAYRRVIERIAARPSKGYLYQLAADLAEERNEPERQREMTELFAIVAGERRSSVLRELMELAQINKQPAELLKHGRGLLAIGEEMPPQVFLDLGEALVQTGDLRTAERVFARAATSGDFASTQKRVAETWRTAGQYEAAERALREALIASPDDPELMLDAADVALDALAPLRARDDLLRVIAVLARETPSKISGGADEGTTRVIRTAFGTRVIRIGGAWNPNQDPYERLRERLFDLLPRAADASLFASVKGLIEEEIALLRAGQLVAEKPADNLRLSRLYDLARRIAFNVQDFAGADALDLQQFELWPKAKDRSRAAVEERVRIGRFADAQALAAKLEVKAADEFPELLRRMWLEPATRPKERAAIEVEDLLELAPSLAAAGESELVQELLRAQDPERPGVDPDLRLELYRLVRRDLGVELAEPHFRSWIEALALDSGDREGLGVIEPVLRGAWGEVSEATRARAVQVLVEAHRRAKDGRKNELATVLRATAALTGIEPPPIELPSLESERERLAKSSGNGYVLFNAFVQAPFDLQPQLLSVLEGEEKKFSAVQLLGNIPRAVAELHPDTHPFFLRIVKAGIGQVNPLSWNWILSSLGSAERNRTLCSALLREVGAARPDEPAVRMQTWRFELLSATAEERTAILAKVEDWLKKATSKSAWAPGERQVIGELLNGAIPELAEVALAAVEAAAARGQRSADLSFALARARLRAGRLTEALADLERAAKAGAATDEVNNQRLAILRRLGREEEVLDAELTAAAGASGNNGWVLLNLARSVVRFGRAAEAVTLLERARPAEDLGLSIALALHLGDEAKARRLYAQFLNQSRFGSPGWPRFPLLDAGAPPRPQRTWPKFAGALARFGQSLHAEAAQVPALREELRAASRRIDLADALELDDFSLAIAWLGIEDDETGTVAGIAARAAAPGDPSRLDRLQLLLLGSREGVPLPEPLWPALERLERDALAFGAAAQAEILGQIGRIHLGAGRLESARRIFAALRGRTDDSFNDFEEVFVSTGSVMAMSSIRMASSAGAARRNDAWTELWLQTFHEAERFARRDALLRAEERGAGENPSVVALIGLLEGWFALGNPEEVQRLEAALAARLARDEADPKINALQRTDLRGRVLRYAAKRGDLAWVDALLRGGQFHARPAFARGVLAPGKGLAHAAQLAQSWRAHLERQLGPPPTDPKSASTAPGSDASTVAAPGAPATAPGAPAAPLAVLSPNEASEAWLDFAQWCDAADLKDEAKAALSRVDLALIEAGATRLQVAALRRSLGDVEQALSIEVDLLAARALPPERIAPVIEHLEAKQGRPAARRALEAALGKIAHPDLLRTAIRFAEEALDKESAARWRSVLQSHHPRAPLTAVAPPTDSTPR